MTAPYAPVITTPSTPDGQLSNTRGSNLTTDAIKTALLYRNPRGVSDLAGTIRVTVDRLVSAGQPVTPQRLWDSSWMGTPVENPFPASTLGGTSAQAAVYGGRVYVLMVTPNAVSSTAGLVICSAQITGPTTGRWRPETRPPAFLGLSYFVSMAIVPSPQPWLYAVGDDRNIYYAPINSDGTLGAWQQSKVQVAVAGALVGGYSLNSIGQMQGWLMVIGSVFGTGTAHTPSANVQINGLNVNYGPNDGTLNGWVAQTALPAARANPSVYYDPVGNFVVVVGGDDGTNATTTVWTAQIGALGALTSAWAVQTAMPVARSGAGVVVAPNDPGTGVGGTIFVICGTFTALDSSAQNTVYANSISPNGTIGAGAWPLVSPPGLPQSLNQPAVWLTGKAWGANREWLAVACGRTPVGDNLTVYVNSQSSGGALGTTWLSGTNKPLGAILGTGSSVGSGALDGTQAISFNYGGFGAAAVGAVADGDQLQYSIQFTDALDGDPSPAAQYIIKIGQPPTITNAAPAAGTLTNPQPAASLNYNPGAGGGQEAWYRVQVMDVGETITYFDSGQRTDGLNTVLLSMYPLFAGGGSFHIIFSVSAADVSMLGSSASASVVNAVTTSFLAVNQPTGGSAGVDIANGILTIFWTNPNASNAASNRIYRRTGGGAWRILKDGIVAVTTGTQQSVQLMDDIPLNTPTDYAVSGVTGGATGGESPLTIVATGVAVRPDYHFDLGGYQAMLHVVGNGVAQHMPIFLTGQPKITRNVDVSATLMFGNVQPTHRYGPGLFREIELPLLMQLSGLVGAEAVLQAAQAGSVLCYRDVMGTLVYCALAPTLDRLENLYLEDTLRLQETAYTYSP